MCTRESKQFEHPSSNSRYQGLNYSNLAFSSDLSGWGRWSITSEEGMSQWEEGPSMSLAHGRERSRTRLAVAYDRGEQTWLPAVWAASEALTGTPVTHCHWLTGNNQVHRLARPLTCTTVIRRDTEVGEHTTRMGESGQVDRAEIATIPCNHPR